MNGKGWAGFAGIGIVGLGRARRPGWGRWVQSSDPCLVLGSRVRSRPAVAPVSGLMWVGERLTIPGGQQGGSVLATKAQGVTREPRAGWRAGGCTEKQLEAWAALTRTPPHRPWGRRSETRLFLFVLCLFLVAFVPCPDLEFLPAPVCLCHLGGPAFLSGSPPARSPPVWCLNTGGS